MEYEEFIKGKSQLEGLTGFEPLWMPDCLFDFQRTLVDWSVRKGCAAIFADCGLGKSLMQLVWAENVVRKTNRPVLILTPLAVGFQTVQEATKFGIEAERSFGGPLPKAKIVVTNYEKLHLFDPNDFAGVVCDESSILKSFKGKTRIAITAFMRKHQYRLLCTATAAPNDYHELGTSSDALGGLGQREMLTKFFANRQNSCDPRVAYRGKALDDSKWSFRGHAEQPFWRWVCSWARAIRRPSDIGGDDALFELPPLTEAEHCVDNVRRDGMLFAMPAVGLREQRGERRASLELRCSLASDIANGTDGQVAVWGHLNDECDMMAESIRGAIQVSGSDSDESKEEKFASFLSGESRVLVTKPIIGAWGLNMQNCHRMVTFPSHSFEQYYQSVRRFWRFGQKRPVHVDIVTSPGEQDVLKNLRRKQRQADSMFSSLVEAVGRELEIERINQRVRFTKEEEIPSWL